MLLGHVLHLGADHAPEAGHGGKEAIGIVRVDVPLHIPLGPHHQKGIPKGGHGLPDSLYGHLHPLHEELGAVAELLRGEGGLGIALHLGGLGQGKPQGVAP